MHDDDNYFNMVSIKSSQLSEPYILCMISIKSSRLSEPYVPIKWLPLVNSWSLWNYTLNVIFNNFNCSISITISLNIASKGQITTSQLLHWLQSVTSHHLNQWWASMMHICVSRPLWICILDWLFMFGSKPLKESVDCNVSEKNREIWVQ